jgi:tetratricopeptide (TPR) repeat protein
LNKTTLPDPILVGRKSELEELKRFLDLALKGKGTTVFISGEAGSGKTRLITEFLKTAKKKGVTVLAGWCLSDAAVPYFPFVEAFDSYLSMSEGEGASVVNQKMALKSWLSATSQSELSEKFVNLQPHVWKDRAFHGVTKELLFLSARNPLIVVLDDIHWADSASLSLLHYLARQVGSERILILATFRKEELGVDSKGHPNQLSRVLLLMGRDDLYKEIKLSNLGSDDVGRIAESMLEGSVHPELVEKLASDSRGNPLFVVESLRMLYQQGSLSKKDGRWSLCVDKFDVPRKVRDVILRRLEALKPYQRKILDVASVVGEKFDPKLVAAVVSRDNADVLIALNKIAKRTLMVHSKGNGFRFEHEKFREMLYEEVPPLLRREYHLRVAEEMEVANLYGAKVSVSDVAYHFVHADNKIKAIEYSLQAGRDALSRFSNVESIGHFLYAVESTVDDREFINEKVSALEGLGDAYTANCMYAEAIKTFDKLAESGTGSLRLRALRKAMDAAFIKGDKPDLLLDYAKKAEELALDDRLEMARVILNRGRAFAWAGRGEPKLDLADYEAALQVFEEENSLADLAEALWRRGEAGISAEDLFEKGLGYLLRSRAIFRELGDVRKEIGVSRSIGSAFTFLGLFPEAKRELGNVLRVGEKLGVFDELARAVGILGLLDEYEGKFAEALSQILKALEYIEKTDVKYIQCFDFAALTRLYSKLGDLKRADEYFDRITKLPSEVLSTWLVTLIVAVSKGVYYAAKDRWKESNQIFEALAANLENSLFITDYIWALEKQGRVKEAKAQRDRIQKFLEQTQKWFEHANVQLSVMAPRMVQVGEVFEMRLDLVNIAKNPGSLVKVEGLVPSGSKVISLPSFCSTQNSSIKINNKRIGPFQVEPIKIKGSFEAAGVYDLDPILYYTDDLGEPGKAKAKPITITVQLGSGEEKTKRVIELSVGKLEFKSEAAEKVFNFLVSAFERDYLSRRMPREKSGWRTRMEIVRNAKVTMYSVYGRSGQGGKVTSELADLGLVESRFFLGERGRGGRVLKMRICYEKEPVKQRVAQQGDFDRSKDRRPD